MTSVEAALAAMDTAEKEARLPLRFWRKVVVADSGCWEWTGHISRDGYGRYSQERRMERAHRVAYVALVGPIEPPLVLDHLCRNRSCVNPDHLEPVSRYENNMRGESPVAANADKTHCPQGHPYSIENTAYRTLPSGRTFRRCKACHRTREAGRRKREDA